LERKILKEVLKN